MDFLVKAKIFWPRFRNLRDFKNLTQDSLKFAVKKNFKLQNLTKLTDPDLVAETLQGELNSIINHLAPQRRVVNNKINQPYLDNDIRDEMTAVKGLLTRAIQTGESDIWREHNNRRNFLYKRINKAKAAHLTARLCNDRTGWKEIQQFNGLNKAVTPNKIIHDGKVVTSPKDIADIANIHYINKIVKLNEAMSHEKRDPVALLSRLIPRYKGAEFRLKLISLKETNDMIKNLNNTNSTGDDAISNKIIKKIGRSIVPQVCHMINCVM